MAVFFFFTCNIFLLVPVLIFSLSSTSVTHTELPNLTLYIKLNRSQFRSGVNVQVSQLQNFRQKVGH